ncbi:MAG: hypothetical protein ACI36Y_01895 [Coriobacteriales bacterium]
MLKIEDIEGLEPTPVERPLVDAIQEHGHDGWPYIYLALRDVTKDDLLADAEYCSRHRHPSVTQYLEECALFGGAGGITMMRKYERAGKRYEAVRANNPSLPPVTDPKVCAVSPDAFNLLDSVAAYLEHPSADKGELVARLMGLLVGELLEGRGMTRRQMRDWLSRLKDAQTVGDLEQYVDKFLAQAAHDIESATPDEAVRALCSAVKSSTTPLSSIRALLLEGRWLAELGVKDLSPKPWQLSVIDEPRLMIGQRRYILPDFAVVETLTSDMSVHFFEVKLGRAFDGMGLNELSTMLESGADYLWLVTGAQCAEQVRKVAERLGLGILVFSESSLEVCVVAGRQEPDPEKRSALYRELLKRSFRLSFDTNTDCSFAQLK